MPGTPIVNVRAINISQWTVIDDVTTPYVELLCFPLDKIFIEIPPGGTFIAISEFFITSDLPTECHRSPEFFSTSISNESYNVGQTVIQTCEDNDGNVYLSLGSYIVKIPAFNGISIENTPEGYIGVAGAASIIVGKPGYAGYVDSGAGTTCRIDGATSLQIDGGMLYWVERQSNVIRRYNLATHTVDKVLGVPNLIDYTLHGSGYVGQYIGDTEDTETPKFALTCSSYYHEVDHESTSPIMFQVTMNPINGWTENVTVDTDLGGMEHSAVMTPPTGPMDEIGSTVYSDEEIAPNGTITVTLYPPEGGWYNHNTDTYTEQRGVDIYCRYSPGGEDPDIVYGVRHVIVIKPRP